MSQKSCFIPQAAFCAVEFKFRCISRLEISKSNFTWFCQEIPQKRISRFLSEMRWFSKTAVLITSGKPKPQHPNTFGNKNRCTQKYWERKTAVLKTIGNGKPLYSIQKYGDWNTAVLQFFWNDRPLYSKL